MRDVNDLKKIIDANLDKIDMSQNMKLKLKAKTKNNRKVNFKKLGFIGTPIVAAILVFLILFTNVFPVNWRLTLHGNNLMYGISSHKVKAAKADDSFISSTEDFSIDLFRHSYTRGKNSLISPLSVYLALGMSANGADGNTLKEFETLLGKQNLNISSLNSHYKSLSDSLTDTKEGKLHIANSIWYRNDKSLNVKKAFLQANADYYNASAYKADFTSPSTVQDINSWVKDNTGKKIDKIINEIDPNDMMYLINAVYFEQKWETPYEDQDVNKDPFELIDGTKKSVDFMCSTEAEYINDNMSEGFIKPYKNEKYSFVAILPYKGINIYDYISSLTGESFRNLINSKSSEEVSAELPKFTSEYQIDLVDPLKQMGLKECFSSEKANFSKMATNNAGNIYIGDVLHKTYISVDEQGTKAAAVTGISTAAGCCPPKHNINLNRPFIYAIIDNGTKLPIFIGVMMDPCN